MTDCYFYILKYGKRQMFEACNRDKLLKGLTTGGFEYITKDSCKDCPYKITRADIDQLVKDEVIRRVYAYMEEKNENCD